MVDSSRKDHLTGASGEEFTICTETITNENLEMFFFAFAFVMERQTDSPQIFFHIRFCNDHVGHAQATTAGHTYEKEQIPRDFLSLSLS